MKKTGIKILVGTLFIGILSSCLKIDSTDEANRENEQLALKKYLDYISANGNNVDTTDLGVYYVTLDKGTGPFPENGDTLTLGYAGYFIDNTIFDSSAWHNQADSTLTFVLGNPPMIKGWDDGMKVINKNARVQLIIPSELAYGSSGAGAIPPYKTLVFVVIMKNIKPSI